MRSVREGFHRLGLGLVAVVWLLWLAMVLFLGLGTVPDAVLKTAFAAAVLSLLVYVAMLLLAWIIDGFTGAEKLNPIVHEDRRYSPGAFKKAAILGVIIVAVNVIVHPDHSLRQAVEYGGIEWWARGMGEAAAPILVCVGLVALFGRRRRPASQVEIITPMRRVEPPMR